MRKYLFSLLIISSLAIVSDANITGAFWQLNGSNTNKPRSYWAEELDLMQAIGMDTVIIQFSATDSERFFGHSTTASYRFDGPFKAGHYEIVIDKGPLIVSEIETPVPFSYEIKGAEPSPMFGDDGEKLKDKSTASLDSGVVWLKTDKPIVLAIDLKEQATSISLFSGSLSTASALPQAGSITLNRQSSKVCFEDDYSYLLEEAQKREMKVWLGLKLSNNWWSGQLDLKKDCEENLALAHDLVETYGSYTSFYGFYIPHELYPSTPTLPLNYLNFFRDLTLGLQKFSKPVSIAPYFSSNMMPRSHGKYWDKFFEAVPLDVLMLQDGVGCHRLPVAQIPRFYNEVYAVCKKHNVEFWSDLEVFDQLPGEGFSAEPADFSRVKEQVLTQMPTVDKIVIFDWPHYMSPNRNLKAKALYDTYFKGYQNK